MSKRCEDVTDRLLELLYDELPADERAALQAHIAGCARCQAEVATFEKTRSLARAGLAEPAPAGVRQRLLAAAAAAVPAARPIAAERVDSRRGQGRWAWLRQHWTLPTLATVGAMAVFLLASRVFLNPDKTYQRGQEISAPAAKAPPQAVEPIAPPAGRGEQEHLAGASPPAPSPQRAAPAQVAKRARQRDTAVGGLAPPDQGAPRSSGGAAGLGSIAQQPEVARHRKAELKKTAADNVTGAFLGQSPEADKPNPFPGVSGGGLHAVGDNPEPLADAEKVRVMEKKGARAAPTPPRAPLAEQFAPRAQAAAPPAAPPPAPKAAAPAAAAPPAEAAASRAPARAPAKMDEEAPAVLENLSSRNTTEGGKAADEPLPQKAERLFGLQRWAEAAAAFEQLIRQYPQSPSVPRWRQRLAVARERAGPRAGH